MLPEDAHKGDAGRVLLVCGSEDMPGAAVLVARAAQRAGAGLVAVACLDAKLGIIVPIAAPEAVLVNATGDPVVALAGRTDDARVLGPGLGASERTEFVVRALLAGMAEGAWVLDADALNVLDGDLEALRSRRGPMVGRVAAACEISRRAQAVCCLKGHRTVVVDGDRVYVNETGNPGMATAGAGDVLAGVLGAYLALCRTGSESRWTPFEAASSAVHVHGLAGDLAAAEVGRRGLIASDLVRFLPAAQARLH